MIMIKILKLKKSHILLAHNYPSVLSMIKFRPYSSIALSSHFYNKKTLLQIVEDFTISIVLYTFCVFY